MRKPPVQTHANGACPPTDHPALHAQVPAARSRHQEGLQQRTVSQQAGAQRGRSEDLQLPRDGLHHRHRLPEPAGKQPPHTLRRQTGFCKKHQS